MITTGVTGRRWRASITASGAIDVWDGPQLDWFVGADDRWHDPAAETSVRQRRQSGTPVTETRLRVPGGDIVQTIYSCADHGGLTVLEFTNESSMAVAIVLSHRNLLTERPIPEVAPAGIDVPEGCVLPLGHSATIRVALAHAGPSAGRMPFDLPSAAQIERGWLTLTERASRLVLPEGEQAATDRATAERCELALIGPVDVGDDPVAFALGLHELVRMGESPAAWLDDLAAAVEAVARNDGWENDVAIDAAARILHHPGERKALADIDRIRGRRTRRRAPSDSPPGVRSIAWLERRLVAGSELLPDGFPASWLGQSFEVYGVPAGDTTSVSFAVRWHGERPAVLWEQTGPPLTLTAPVCAPGWSASDPAGEALWPAPAA